MKKPFKDIDPSIGYSVALAKKYVEDKSKRWNPADYIGQTTPGDTKVEFKPGLEDGFIAERAPTIEDIKTIMITGGGVGLSNSEKRMFQEMLDKAGK